MFIRKLSLIILSLRRNKKRILAFSWLTGILLGAWFAQSMDASLRALVLDITRQALTLWSSLWAACCPVLLTAFASHYGVGWVLFVSSFLGFRFGFSCCAIQLTFGSSGWLIQLLYLFPDYLLIPWLYFLWLRLISKRSDAPRGFAILFFLALLLGLIQFRVISPFLSSLF